MLTIKCVSIVHIEIRVGSVKKCKYLVIIVLIENSNAIQGVKSIWRFKKNVKKKEKNG